MLHQLLPKLNEFGFKNGVLPRDKIILWREKGKKKNLAEELGVIIWVPEQTAICMNALLINIFMIYKYIEIFRKKKQNLKAVFILWCQC